MKKEMNWLFMILLLCNLAAQAVSLTAPGKKVQPKQKKIAGTVQPKTKPTDKQVDGRHWVLNALFKIGQ